MDTQLALLDLDDDPRLDDHTRELGRAGVAVARRALADARRKAA